MLYTANTGNHADDGERRHVFRVPVDQAKMTRDEFYPKEALQLAEVKGIEVTLQQALDFKYVTKPMTKDEVAPLFDLLAEKR